MEHLWAPWRMAYIDANAEKDQGCVFCVKPAQGQEHDEEKLVLYRGERCFVLMNLFPLQQRPPDDRAICSRP